MRLKHQPPEHVKQTPHIVAFLDFLGATEKMKSEEESDVFLQEIYTVYSFANHVLEKTEEKRDKKLKVKIFSDNIFIAEEIEEPQDPQKLYDIYTEVEQFSLIVYCEALLSKNLMRGAISMGKLYMDDTFVFGEALINAHDAESKIANYPRIVVDKSIWSNFELPDHEGLVRHDADGELYLSPFWGVPKISEYDRLKANILLFAIRQIIEAEYWDLFKKNQKVVLPKYYWLANQFNEYCRQNDFTHFIDLDKAENRIAKPESK